MTKKVRMGSGERAPAKKNQNRDPGLKEKKKEWAKVRRQEEQEINQGRRRKLLVKAEGRNNEWMSFFFFSVPISICY